jgi:hypothetical protein
MEAVVVRIWDLACYYVYVDGAYRGRVVLNYSRNNLKLAYHMKQAARELNSLVKGCDCNYFWITDSADVRRVVEMKRPASADEMKGLIFAVWGRHYGQPMVPLPFKYYGDGMPGFTCVWRWAVESRLRELRIGAFQYGDDWIDNAINYLDGLTNPSLRQDKSPSESPVENEIERAMKDGWANPKASGRLVGLG